MSEQIPVGSWWRDKDPRMRDRRVLVEKVDGAFVWYRTVVGVRSRSRCNRFVKAFARMDQPLPVPSGAVRQQEPRVCGTRPCDAALRIGIEIDMLRAFIQAHPDGDIDGLLDSLDNNVKREFAKFSPQGEAQDVIQKLEQARCATRSAGC